MGLVIFNIRGLDFLRLGVSNSYVCGLDFLRFWVSNSYFCGLVF